MTRVAANVGRPAFAGEGADASRPAQEIERSIRGRKREVRVRAPGAVVQLDDSEAAPRLRDRVQDSAALRGDARSPRQAQLRCMG